MNFKDLIKLSRLWFLIGFSFIKRFRFWAILVISIIVILVFIQVKFNLFFQNNIIKEGFIGTFQENDLPLEVINLLSQSLIQTDENGRLRPNLVSGWEINNDATVFKFKLKEGLKWQDGTEIKSADLQFNIPNTDVSYPDERTIQFALKEPYSPFPTLLLKPIFKKGTLIGIGPYNTRGVATFGYNTRGVATFGYKVAKVEKSRVFITKITLQPIRADLPKIYVRFYPNEKVGISGFNLGEVEALFGLSNPKALTNAPQVNLRQKVDHSKIVTILYNTKDPILLSNRSIRQALSFQSPQIISEEVANNPYPQSSWGYNSDSKKYLNNESEAKAALERAKSAVSDDKLRGELILTAAPNLEEVGKTLVASWKNLGFEAKLRVEPGIPQNFQALLITQSIPSDPDQYSLWHATQTKTNLSKLDSKRVDKDLEDGRKALTEDDRKSKYFDFQKALLEEAPATFLYFPKYNVVYLKKIESLLDKVLSLQLPQ